MFNQILPAGGIKSVCRKQLRRICILIFELKGINKQAMKEPLGYF